MSNSKESTLTIIVPCYNEEDNVEATIKEISITNPSAIILIVDDHSSDKTPEIVKDLQTKNLYNLHLISNKENLGYGGALVAGFLKIKTKYVAFVDADLTYGPKYLPEMEKIMNNQNLDVIWGNRFGGNINEMPFIRKIGNRIISLTCLMMTRKWVSDCASGMRIIKLESMSELDIQSLPNGLDMITAMTKRIIKRNLKYKLLPIDYLARGGQSKLNITSDFIHMMKNIVYEN